VTTVYSRPAERVLFESLRDANPFFHLFEALHMLAGRKDLAFLEQFLPRFKDFSDDGVTLQGAYGYRWRHQFEFDQIERVVTLLRQNVASRRAILQMWDPRTDLRTDEALKDVPCNQQAIFWNLAGRLQMQVNCRSNDICLGAYGANAVHFAFLQEYVAAQLGLEIGTYYQVSTNWHAYLDLYNKLRPLASADPAPCPYARGEVTPYPVVDDPAAWDRDLALFLEDPRAYGFVNRWFARVAKPMWFAHLAHKRHAYVNALEIISECEATDWRRAATEWLQRRQVTWQARRKREMAEERLL
jgi:hypothetical protein